MWYMPASEALGLAAGDLGDRGAAEDFAQRPHPIGPDASRLVGLLADLAVEGLDYLEHVYLLRRAGKRVTTLDATVAGQKPGPAQGREELLEELLGDVPALRELFDRDRALAPSGRVRPSPPPRSGIWM